jgi:epoxyqueuosine reductase
MSNVIREQIIEKSKEYGASSAGIAQVEDLVKSPSYEKYAQEKDYENNKKLPDWPETAKSILVFAVKHPRSEPELDWWDDTPGGTPGNCILIDIQKKMMKFMNENIDLSPQSLPYKLQKGGIFLKDASVLAGIGIIGKNNMLITPEFGPQVRLRAMFLDKDFDPTGPTGFDPCADCDMPCYRACPQDAFRSGSYERKYCKIQMLENECNEKPHPDVPEIGVVQYCRACEFSCPVGNN